eukprot:g56702.t1
MSRRGAPGSDLVPPVARPRRSLSASRHGQQRSAFRVKVFYVCMALIVALNKLLVPSFSPSSSWDFVSAAFIDSSFHYFPFYLNVFSPVSNSYVSYGFVYLLWWICRPRWWASAASFGLYLNPSSILDRSHPAFCGSVSLPYRRLDNPVYVGGSTAQYAKLILRLLHANMVTLLPSSSVVAVNGVFTVPRSDGLLRFIMDARNTNELFLLPGDPDLPGPDCIAQLDIAPSESLWAATSDISNFYDSFFLPSWMVPFMGLPPVFLPGVGVVHPCMLCLPQGFSHAVFLAQSFHLHLISRYLPRLYPADLKNELLNRTAQDGFATWCAIGGVEQATSCIQVDTGTQTFGGTFITDSWFPV